jgi:hypothetical protein
VRHGGSDKDHDKSKRPGAKDQGCSSTCLVLGCKTIERLGDTVYDLHRAQGDGVREFLC